ncbi:hypothetical protein GKZ68_09580 [Hymenobacter sp. BRD128]|uniref:hypothetical protein n=1 Tax=Hymenobacter sp. BRD128 TaxID=2675878 RepID=UPI00156573ED|nr:hypothetical protein [Hymenobacter sp. BRD128]QKG56852.1 hypothetical protein GKZ68_09580 [Hymenobacter sp. BRD128]
MLAGTLKEPAKGLVALEETPYITGYACLFAPEHNYIYISLTTSGYFSFSVSEPALQQAVLEQVSKKFGVHFPAALQSKAFVAVRPELLPSLSATSPSVPTRQQINTSVTLTQAQLLDCIEAARALSPRLTHMPSAVYLSINTQTKASLVMRLVKQLQHRKLNQLYLLTHRYS